MKDGARGASAPARRGADPSPGVRAGTVASPAAGAPGSLTIADIARAKAAVQAAYPGLAAQMQRQVNASFLAGHPVRFHGYGPPRFLGMDYARETPRPPLEIAPMSVGEFVGWRIWRVRLKDRLLQSFSADRIWMPGEPMTADDLTDYGGTGVWAFKDADRAAQKMLDCRNHAWGGEPPMVAGSVWLWGNVVEHADGYRAEFATVRSIDIVTFGADTAALRQRYGVGSAEDADKL